jgi:two-component system, NarL family, response regulator LiaR
MTRILIVDFDRASEARIAAVLRSQQHLHAVTRAVAWDAELPARLVEVEPDIVLMDLGSNGDGRIEAIRRFSPRARVVVQVAGDDATALALRHGASGVVSHDSDIEVLLESIDRVIEGATFLDPRLAARLVRLATRGQRAEGPFRLTLQEMRVLELLSRGLTNRQIADELGLGVATVKTHVHNAMRKLRVRNRTEAAAVAMRNGLV